MTMVNDDGYTVELSWPQVKRRAAQLGLSTVPELTHPLVIPQGINAGSAQEYLNEQVEPLLEGYSTLDENHIREGVCVRIEAPDGDTKVLKAKSFTFGVLEGFIKDSDDYVDTEEIS